MTAVTVRPATTADAAAIGRVDRATHSTTVSPGPGPGERDELFDRYPPEDVLVAEVDGEVVGYALLGRPTPLATNAHVWQLQGLGVDPAVSRRGVGRALLRAAMATASERGARRLTLRVLGHNATARALYEAEGFVVEGVLRGEFVIDGREVDDVLMARRLD